MVGDRLGTLNMACRRLTALVLICTLVMKGETVPVPLSRHGSRGESAVSHSKGRVATRGSSAGGTREGGAPAKSFTVEGDQFVLDGTPFRILSGEIHYFRIPRIYWEDRLRRVKALGFNAIQTYIPWNFHEENEGETSFEGDRDFLAFLSLADELGLLVLLRPGPYICAEWDWGGLPAWLFRGGMKKGIKIRTWDTEYIAAVDAWWGRLLPMVVPMLRENGGPVIMVQIENEFGSYGDVSSNPLDMKYIEHLRALARKILGPNVVLYTTDFGNPDSMRRGSINGSSLLTLGDFGPGMNVSLSLRGQSSMNPPGLNPGMCSEFYSGWYTYWGQAGATNTSSKAAVATMKEVLDRGMSVSVYMAYGGTNFATFAGANIRDGSDPEVYPISRES